MRLFPWLGLLALVPAHALAQDCVTCWKDDCTALRDAVPRCESAAPARREKARPAAPPKPREQPCPEGRERSFSSLNRCCFPGQSWRDGECAGKATSCRAPMLLADPEGICSVPPPTAGEESEFMGIGAVLKVDPAGALVERCLPGSPAERAGLATGEVITHVDDQSLATFRLAVTVGLIRGRQGVPVVLRLRRADTGKTRDVSVVRARVVLPPAPPKPAAP